MTVEADVLLIHGLWMTPLSWEHWIERYESRGYRTIAPSWPGMEGDIDDLRRDPSRIAELSMEAIVDHYSGIIAGMERQPIVMGHSFGGTFVQLLLDRGLGSAGVGIDSATVKGILDLPLSTIRATRPVLSNPLKRNQATGLTEKQFHYAFANTLDDEDSRAAYERYHVPAANRVLFQGALQNFSRHAVTKVDFRKDDRAPLLLIAGGEDHIIPAKVTRHNVDKYKHSKAVTEYKEFPSRSHFTVGEDGWEEVADYALDWAVEHAGIGAKA
jgi:pimeloyl-ACP methyl ester carboxylesterase